MADQDDKQQQQADGVNDAGESNDSGEASKPVETVSFEQFRKLKDQKTNIDAIARDWEKKAKELESKYADVDLEEHRQMKAKVEEAERRAAANDPAKLEEMHERKRAKERQEYEDKLAKSNKENAELQSKLKEFKVTNKVMGEISELFNADVLDIVKDIVASQADDDEEYGVVFRDENDEILFFGSRPLTPKEFGARLVEKRPSLAKATGVTGGSNATNGQKVAGRAVLEPNTYQEFVEMGSSKAVWERLPSEKKLAFAQQMRVGGARQ